MIYYFLLVNVKMLVVVMGDAQHLTCVYAIGTGNQMTAVRVSAHYHHIIHSFIH